MTLVTKTEDTLVSHDLHHFGIGLHNQDGKLEESWTSIFTTA